MGRGRLALIALCALVVVGVGWALLRSNAPVPTGLPGGVHECALGTLPPEVAATVRAIRSDGPFPFPRNDGVVFGNRERHLPERAKGYYHEYTVVRPGASNRSTRRVVTGGEPRTDPPEYFYTDDHYDSFCLITDTGDRR